MDFNSTKDETTIVTSTSPTSADVSSIILKNTEMVRTKFVPKLINNVSDPKKSVSGKLVYEKKRQNDSQFPTEKITRRSVKVGEVMEISLNTTETFALYDGLRKLYKLYDDMEAIPYGETTFIRVDSSFRHFLPQVIAYADRANERLRRKYYKMTLGKGKKSNIAKTAVARELACFMWGMMTDNIA